MTPRRVSSEPTPVVDDLRRRIDAKSVVFLIGAGVSKQATKGDPRAVWDGFMRRGVALAAERDEALGPEWVTTMEQRIESESISERLVIEDDLLAALGGAESPDFADWLALSVGVLEVQDRGVLAAIEALQVPVITLNYDNLIEDATGWPAVTWQDPEGMRRVMARETPGVIHLHGHWSAPASVVVGSKRHEAHRTVRAAADLAGAAAQRESLVLVGFGGSLGDRHFEPLETWTASTGGPRHYRLVLAEDVERFKADPVDVRHVRVVPYGEDFPALAPFLRHLAPSRLKRVAQSVRAVGVFGLVAAVMQFVDMPKLAAALVAAGIVFAVSGLARGIRDGVGPWPAAEVLVALALLGVGAAHAFDRGEPRRERAVLIGAPGHAQAWGLDVEVGRLSRSSGSGVVRQLTVRSARRCPVWRDVRSGDRFRVTRSGETFDLRIEAIDPTAPAAKVAATVVWSSARDGERAGCRRLAF